MYKRVPYEDSKLTSYQLSMHFTIEINQVSVRPGNFGGNWESSFKTRRVSICNMVSLLYSINLHEIVISRFDSNSRKLKKEC